MIKPYKCVMILNVWSMRAGVYGWCHGNLEESIEISDKDGPCDIAIKFWSWLALKYIDTLITKAVVSPNYYNILDLHSRRLWYWLWSVVKSDLQRYRKWWITVNLVAITAGKQHPHSSQGLELGKNNYFNKYKSRSCELNIF